MAKKRSRAKAKPRRAPRARKAKSRRRVSRSNNLSGVSRKTLAVMLVLVIAVSVLGTWVMLNTGSNLEAAQHSATGTIKFNVLHGGSLAEVHNAGPAGGTVSFNNLGLK